VVTNCGEFLPLVRDQSAVLGLDLVCRASFGVKLSRDDDAVTINVVLVCFVATVFQGDCDFGSPETWG
jgi:hypothetical protein